MEPGVPSVYCRDEYIVRPATVYVWPQGCYELPFFLSMHAFASLFPRSDAAAPAAAILALTLLASTPPHITCVQATLNGTHDVFLGRSSQDLSRGAVPGKNLLTLHNNLTLLVTLVVQIELRVAVPIDTCIARIPRHAESLLAIAALSLSPSPSPGDGAVETVSATPSSTCPITLQAIGVAVRGCQCRHPQPFDARAYLLLGSHTGAWQCPVCGYAIGPPPPPHPQDVHPARGSPLRVPRRRSHRDRKNNDGRRVIIFFYSGTASDQKGWRRG